MQYGAHDYTQRTVSLVTYAFLEPPAVSPMRQRAVKGLISGYIFNGYRRLSAQVPYWIVPFAIGEYTSLVLHTVRDDHRLAWLSFCAFRLWHIHMGEELRQVAEQQGWTRCPWRTPLILPQLNVTYLTNGIDSFSELSSFVSRRKLFQTSRCETVSNEYNKLHEYE